MTDIIVTRIEDQGVELYTLSATGESGLSQTGLSLLVGITRQAILKAEPLFFSPDYKSIILKTDKAVLNGNLIGNLVVYSSEFCKRFLMHYYFKGKCTSMGMKYLGIPPVRKTQLNIQSNPEERCRAALWQIEGGELEVITLAGRIDLLTTTEIIEVKQIKSWKGGIGQLLVYSKYYPSHTRRLHIFGKTDTAYLDLVKSHCDDYSIRLTW